MGGDPIPRLHIALREWFEEATRRIRILGRPKEYTGDDDLPTQLRACSTTSDTGSTPSRASVRETCSS